MTRIAFHYMGAEFLIPSLMPPTMNNLNKPVIQPELGETDIYCFLI